MSSFSEWWQNVFIPCALKINDWTWTYQTRSHISVILGCSLIYFKGQEQLDDAVLPASFWLQMMSPVQAGNIRVQVILPSALCSERTWIRSLFVPAAIGQTKYWLTSLKSNIVRRGKVQETPGNKRHSKQNVEKWWGSTGLRTKTSPHEVPPFSKMSTWSMFLLLFLLYNHKHVQPADASVDCIQ